MRDEMNGRIYMDGYEFKSISMSVDVFSIHITTAKYFIESNALWEGYSVFSEVEDDDDVRDG